MRLIALLFAFAAAQGLAHNPSDSYLGLVVDGPSIEGQWDIALRDLEVVVGLDANGNGEISWGEVRASHAAIASYALARLTLRSGASACPARVTGLLVDEHGDGTFAVLRFVATCPDSVTKLDVDYTLLFDVDPQHRGLLRLEHAGATRTAIFSPERSRQSFELAQPSRWQQFLDYGREGVWHIWIGFDHILFLLSLLLPAVLRRTNGRWEPVEAFSPAFWNVFGIVTAFTVAHSITLSLATLGAVALPSRLVEPAIALSVVLAAFNNLRPMFYARRWVVAFLFGLVHGLGFANVLKELGLPQGALALALVGFNLGVEAGQLVIVGAFLPVAFLLRGTAFYRQVVFFGGSALIVLVAGIWLVERSLDVQLAIFAAATRPTASMARPLRTNAMQNRSCPVAAFVLFTLLAACSGERGAPASKGPKPLQVPFVEVADASGARFVHANGMSGEFYFSEIIGSGVALFDYDNDGRIDLLVLQGTPLVATHASTAGQAQCAGRLFRNEPVASAGGAMTFKFTDVTERSGLCSRGYGMGIATGDIDNDGFVDVFITHFGAPNQLFRNNGDGTFTDITKAAGVSGNGAWGSSAAFVDFDRDGLLDLYVANYVDYTIADKRKCHNYTSARDYCAPTTYKPVPGILYRNRGGGKFENVSGKAGITRAYGNGLGVVAADLNADGWPDIFVANDGNPNQLWINQKDGSFRNEADIRGAAVNADGAPEAGMGIDIADFDGNGSEDVFITHLTHEKATLFVNLGAGQFADRSAAAGLYVPTSPYTGFGTAFIDYDNDGWLDIAIVNGAVHVIEELVRARDPFPLHQRKQLFRNLGNGRFEEITESAGPAFALSEVGRGLAVGDLDNDGAADFVVSNNNGPLRVFLNKVGSVKNWVGLRLLTGKRDAYGAKVELRRKEGVTLWRRVHADGSYLSASDPRVLVGLGDTPGIEALVVHWPDGQSESFSAPVLRRYTTLVQGSGANLEGR